MLIVSNEDFAGVMPPRRGTQKDVEKLKNTFQQRRYHVHVKQNLDAQVSVTLGLIIDSQPINIS